MKNDRSRAFIALLSLPQFGNLPVDDSLRVLNELSTDWTASGETDITTYARAWAAGYFDAELKSGDLDDAIRERMDRIAAKRLITRLAQA